MCAYVCVCVLLLIMALQHTLSQCSHFIYSNILPSLSAQPQPIEDPILAFSAAGEINQVQWDASHEDWVAIAFNNCIQIPRV